MKKNLPVLVIIFFIIQPFVYARPFTGFKIKEAKQINAEITFILKNDSEGSITIQTSKGKLLINKNASYKFSLEEGERVYLLDKNNKEILLVIVSINIKNKRLLISELL